MEYIRTNTFANSVKETSTSKLQAMIVLIPVQARFHSVPHVHLMELIQSVLHVVQILIWMLQLEHASVMLGIFLMQVNVCCAQQRLVIANTVQSQAQAFNVRLVMMKDLSF